MTDFFARAYEDPLAAAKAFKAGGGKVVGYMTNNVPVELIVAAGAFPLQLPTRPGAPTPNADRYMESLFDPMVRSVFERILVGEFDFLDLIVLPRSVDSFQRFYYYLCELRRTGTAAVPEPFLYDLQKLPGEASAAYNLDRTRDFAAKLRALTGSVMDPEAIARAIDAYNQLRKALSALSERRHAPASLTGEAAFLAYAAVGCDLPDVVEAAVAARLAEAETPLPAGPRLLLIGSAQDQPVLHRVVAGAGGEVVGDYHWRGEPLLGPTIEVADDPLDAISDHYHRRSFATRSYPPSTEDVVNLAKATGADAAIFFYFAEEEALVWDGPAQVAALEAMGLRTLVLNAQAYPPSPDNLQAIVPFLQRSPA